MGRGIALRNSRRNVGEEMTQAVFGEYDQAGLDGQYNNRQRVPDHMRHIAAWPADSAATREALPWTSHAYGSTPAETLDLFPGNGSGSRPLMAFFHGGYWTALDKRDFSFLARSLVPAGITLAVVGYALVPSVSMDILVRQCRAATGWLWRNAARLGGDPERLFVAGHSAGGHIVGMLLAGDWAAAQGLPAGAVRGGVSLSGLFDLEPIRLSYLNAQLGLDAAAVARLSPIARPIGPAPALLAVGATESAEYHRQTDLYAGWRQVAGRASDVVRPEGLNHFSIMSALGEADHPLTRRVLAFVGR